MRRIFIFNLTLLTVAALAIRLVGGHAQAAEGAPAMNAPKGTPSALTRPVRDLFSHPRHKKAFEQLKLSCTDCHKFSVRGAANGLPGAKGGDPLAAPVASGHLQPFKQLCHQCHLGTVALPRPNQCQLCHVDTQSLRPLDHYESWIQRHGRFAQMDRDSCAQCHGAQTCGECHAKRNSVMPVAHPPNFRLTHSIEARANPAKCVLCHQSAGFCIACHTGARR